MSNLLIPQNNCNLSRYFQKIKVDSFKLRIESEKVQIVSTTFCEKYQKIYVTGELEDTFNLEKHKTDVTNGISTRIGVVSSTVGKGEPKEFIYFQLNSKMLKDRYLEGITDENINLIYDYMMNLKIVYVSYKDFLEGYVSDIDFAYDVEISPEHMKQLNTIIFSKVSEKKQKFVDKPFGRQDNVGIQFNRRDKATPSSPFIKIYHKGIEFATKSNEFYQCYLKGVNLDNYGRLEYTLKNAKHQKYVGIEIRTLNQLITIDRLMIENIVVSGISENYIDKKIIVRDYTKLTATQRVLLFLIENLIERGADKTTIYGVLDTFKKEIAADRRDKPRAKKLLDSVIERVEVGKKLQMYKNVVFDHILRIFKLK